MSSMQNMPSNCLPLLLFPSSLVLVFPSQPQVPVCSSSGAIQ